MEPVKTCEPVVILNIVVFTEKCKNNLNKVSIYTKKTLKKVYAYIKFGMLETDFPSFSKNSVSTCL